MSDPGVENTSMYWPVDSVTRLPSVLFWTERPLCALALQRFTRAAEKKQKKKHLLKTNPTAASWSWTCLQPRPNKGAGFKNIQWIKQRKQRKKVSHLTWRGPTWFASRYYGPNQDCSTITPVFLSCALYITSHGFTARYTACVQRYRALGQLFLLWIIMSNSRRCLELTLLIRFPNGWFPLIL